MPARIATSIAEIIGLKNQPLDDETWNQHVDTDGRAVAQRSRS